MSFLKKLFDKVRPDDDKYGKGHRLGDSKEEQRRQREREEAAAAIANRPKTSASLRPNSNEAAQAAGQAALARLQQPKQQPNRIQKQTDDEKNRLEEAQKLKEHYFGSSHKTEHEASAHISGQKIEITFKCPDLFGESLSLPKQKMEESIEDKLMENLNNEPILTAMTLLFTVNYKNDEKLQKFLETFGKIIDNIVANPSEEKYRKIRCENAQIKEKILSLKYSELVLTVGGFKLLKVKKEGTNENEDFYVFDHEDAKNYEKLFEIKESFKIVQPIKPALDRNIRLMRLSEGQNDANNFNLCNDFYNLNINELKREQKQREEALEKSGVLRTKAMRDRDEVIELRKYNFCLIRIKFSDLIYLQLVFKSNENLKDLFLTVQSCLRDESIVFELSNYVLKTQQQQNLMQTFAECGLAPAALLHFRAASVAVDMELFKENLLFDIRSTFV
jgi:UBX domain-containing protein 6